MYLKHNVATCKDGETIAQLTKRGNKSGQFHRLASSRLNLADLIPRALKAPDNKLEVHGC